jgi:hypothetical protein
MFLLSLIVPGWAECILHVPCPASEAFVVEPLNCVADIPGRYFNDIQSDAF